MNHSLHTYFLKKATLGFILLGALQTASAASFSMQEVNSLRAEIVKSVLERYHNPTKKYFYVPSHEATTLADVVESYIPRTYAQTMQGKYNIMASPTEGIVGFKRRPGKKAIKFAIAPHQAIYTKNTQSVGIALSPHNQFFSIICIQSNGDHTLRHYVIEDPLLRRGVQIHESSLKSSLSNAQELGEFVGIHHGNQHTGVGFENCFFRTITSQDYLKSKAYLQGHSLISVNEQLKKDITEMQGARTFMRTGLLITTSTILRSRFPLVALGPLGAALLIEYDASNHFKQKNEHLKDNTHNFNPATRKQLKEQPDYFSQPENFDSWRRR